MISLRRWAIVSVHIVLWDDTLRELITFSVLLDYLFMKGEL